MGALDDAMAHFEARGRREILVPEWGKEGEPLKIYSSPLTIRDRDKCNKVGFDTAAMFVEMVLLKAQTEGGEPMFANEPDARHKLATKCDSEVISRIAREIMAGPTLEDLEKK